MYPYWEAIIEPLLKAARPECLVEIGCENGNTTKLILSYCMQHDAVLHGIDPDPSFAVEMWRRRSENRLIFHRKSSLEALPDIAGCDVVLLDGDHNWYTVFHELKAIEDLAKRELGGFPVVLVHDVGWPYGRRDLYYDPERIPAEFRHPFARQGIAPGSRTLVESGGLNAALCNAVEEGGPRNGVLTAVEDFLAQTSADLDWLLIPGFHGLGILSPSALRNTNPDFAEFFRVWNLSEEQQAYLRRLESSRLQLALRLPQR